MAMLRNRSGHSVVEGRPLFSEATCPDNVAGCLVDLFILTRAGLKRLRAGRSFSKRVWTGAEEMNERRGSSLCKSSLWGFFFFSRHSLGLNHTRSGLPAWGRQSPAHVQQPALPTGSQQKLSSTVNFHSQSITWWGCGLITQPLYCDI